MKVMNKSRKIIAIAEEPILPGEYMELPEGYDSHPSIAYYIKTGVLTDAEKISTENIKATETFSEDEKRKIAEAAVAKYKEEQEILTSIQTKRDSEIKAVKTMKKEELISKAMGMGIEIEDSDTADVIKGKILDKLNQ